MALMLYGWEGLASQGNESQTQWYGLKAYDREISTPATVQWLWHLFTIQDLQSGTPDEMTFPMPPLCAVPYTVQSYVELGGC